MKARIQALSRAAASIACCALAACDGGTLRPPSANYPPAVLTISGPTSTPVGGAASFPVSFADPDGLEDIVSVVWEWQDGSPDLVKTGPFTVGTELADHSFVSADRYSVRVTVTDRGGLKDAKSFDVTVVAANNPPLLTGLIGNTTPVVGASELYTATINDPDGLADLARVEWDWQDDGVTDLTTNGPFASAAVSEGLTWGAAGRFTIRATLFDDAGDADTRTLTVDPSTTPVNARPQATGLVGATGPAVGIEEAYDVTVSDADGLSDIDRVEWDFDNDGGIDATEPGPLASATVGVLHTWTRTGDTAVRVVVYDAANASDAQMLPVTVVMPPANYANRVTAAVCQLNAVDYDLSGNLAKMDACAGSAAAAGAEIVVFPELMDVGFGSIVKAANGAELGSPIPGANTNTIGAMAANHGVWIAAAVLEVVPGGAYDTAILIDDRGEVVLKQRKSFVYPVFGGADSFQGNLHDMQTVDTPWGPVSMLNCVETNSASTRQLLLDQKPALILLVFANPQSSLLVNANTLAADGGVPVVAVNMVWPGAVNPGGRSRFVDASGSTLWEAGTSEIMQTWVLDLTPPQNNPPRVVAGDVQTIELPNDSALLQGYASDDARPFGTLSTSWSKVSGPGSVVFADPSALNTNAQFSLPGAYTLRLTADDGDATSSHDVAINVLPVGGDDPDWVGYWTFDNTTADARRSNDGALVGGASYTSDTAPTAFANTGALDLTGGGRYVRIPHHASLDATRGATLAMWIKPNSYPGFFPSGNDWGFLINKGLRHQENYSLGFGAYYYLFAQGMGALVPSLDDSVRTPHAWYHVAAVFDRIGGRAKIYVDGVLDHSTFISTTDFTNTEPLLIGTNANTAEDVDALIDDVRVYRRALSDAEIAQLANPPVFNTPPSVLAGADRVATVGVPITLRGSYSDSGHAPTDAVATWTAWRAIQAPAPVAFSAPFSPQTDATFSAPGLYVLELRGSDGGHIRYDATRVDVGP